MENNFKNNICVYCNWSTQKRILLFEDLIMFIFLLVFLLHLIKSWERTLKTSGEIGEHKLNEMGALNMK